jgi:hypothetical protein
MTKTQTTRFIKSIRETGNISKSCIAAGISRQTYYNNMYNPAFSKAVKEAMVEYIKQS